MQIPASLRSDGWKLCRGPGGSFQMEWVEDFSGIRIQDDKLLVIESPAERWPQERYKSLVDEIDKGDMANKIKELINKIPTR